MKNSNMDNNMENKNMENNMENSNMENKHMENSNMENKNMENNMENSNMENSNMENSNMENRRRGRQRITMERMSNETNLQVTFSKRRFGVFKKASELCTLCGVDAGIIVFSPGQKVYSFGYPSVDALVNLYAISILNPNAYVNEAEGFRPNPALLHELNMELTHFQTLLDAENARAVTLKNQRKAIKDASYWWDVQNKDKLNLEQLERLKSMMENLHFLVNKKQQDLMLASHSIANMSFQIPPLPPFDAGANAMFSQVPYVGMDGAGPSGTNYVPYDYHPGYF